MTPAVSRDLKAALASVRAVLNDLVVTEDDAVTESYTDMVANAR